MEKLFKFLGSLAALPPDLQAALVVRTLRETHRQRKTILSQGQVCDWIAFVESGLIKVCYDVPGGDERIVEFAKAGDVVFSSGSFIGQLPSKLAIVAVEESVIRKISKQTIDELTQKFPVFNTHIRKIIEGQTNALEEHYFLYLLSARERYYQLVKNKHWILTDERIKDFMVADYLGIGRGTFSRLKNGE